MCFFYSLSKKAMEYRNRAKSNEMLKVFYFTNGFNYPLLPIITNRATDIIQQANWGLIPSWANDKSIRQYTLNAKSESIFEKPSFKTPIKEKRCLVLADGFFEWKHVNGRKYPHYIRLKDNETFTFAGVWDEWIDPSNGDTVKSYSILTTPANELMADIHNTKKRMPLILPHETEFEWLNNDLSVDQLKKFFKPFDTDLMCAHTIAPNPSDKIETLDSYNYPELNQNLLF